VIKPRGWEGDYLVCAMSARMLRLLPVKPALPEGKSYAITNVPYYHDTRVILQSRTQFWTRDGVSPNMEFGEASLYHVWRTSEEVKTTRGLLAGTASGAGTADRALATYRKYYPGRSESIEKAHVVVWALDPWASACERTSYAPGQLARFWPVLIDCHEIANADAGLSHYFRGRFPRQPLELHHQPFATLCGREFSFFLFNPFRRFFLAAAQCNRVTAARKLRTRIGHPESQRRQGVRGPQIG
jgi:flavin-dependent amine oxidoreductase